MECKICGKKTNAARWSKEGYVCSLCDFLMNGKKMNDSADYEIRTPSGIVVWIKDLKIVVIWFQNGCQSIGLKVLPEGSTVEEGLEKLEELLKSGFCTCSKCGNVMDESEIAGSHFAGTYCKECWTKYQENNSSKCGMCRQPYWKCTC